MNIRKIAYEIVVKVLKKAEYSDNLLNQKIKSEGIHGSDASLLYNLVKGTVKLHQKFDYIIRQFTDAVKYDKTDIKVKVIIYLGLYQLMQMNSIPDHAAINETVNLAKETFGDGIGGFVNSILRSYQRQNEIAYPALNPDKIAMEHSYPTALIDKWINLWGEDNTELLAIYFNEPSKLHIRVNTLATNRDKLMQYFAKRNIACLPSPVSANILLSDQAADVLDDVAFSEGYFSVQDTSAALVVELLQPKPGDNILDLFSAPGGKSTYLAELMGNSGEVVTVDKTPNKMKLLKQATERLQLDIISIVVKDAFTYGPVAPAYDKVLVDAPCSGWGVIGKKADLRWQKHQDMDGLLKLQEKALAYAASFVKPGGNLVYSTCTMNPAENEEQVFSFLKKNKHFFLVKADTIINPYYTEEGFLKTHPVKHDMDGAFAAKLARKT